MVGCAPKRTLSVASLSCSPTLAVAVQAADGCVEKAVDVRRVLLRHPERERIEALRASGASLESLGRKFKVHKGRSLASPERACLVRT